jgi:hypothetical protein
VYFLFLSFIHYLHSSFYLFIYYLYSKKHQKDESDRLYGRLIKKQLHDEHMAAEALKKSNNDFGVLEDLTAKKTEDLQKFRMEV